jgi:hypothetical protein
MDTSHLNALTTRLYNERNRLTAEKTEAGRKLRQVWISQIEKEIAGEEKFLGIDVSDIEMSDDDLLAELAA